MKNAFFIISITAFLLMSCALTPEVIFDDKVPIEQTAWIAPVAGNITNYNTIPVNWKKKNDSATRTDNMIQIPAGNTLLEWELNSIGMDGTYYTGKGLWTSFNFQPQKVYLFFVAHENNRPGLDVYEYDFGKKIKTTYKDIEPYKIGFAPFINVSAENIVLNNSSN